MEAKKTNRADLEGKRTTGFLLGLILVIAVLFVAFEYTDNNKPAKQDRQSILDELQNEMDLAPYMDKKDMISTAPSPTSPSVTERIKPVDRPVEGKERLSPDTNPLLIGNGEGLTKDANVTQALPQIPIDDEKPVNFRIVEQLPEFPGGMVEFMKWLTKNLKYPILAQQQQIEGKVVVSFIVNKDGSIVNIKLEKSIHPLLDREALRVMRMMPKWKPGIENAKPCRTLFAIPVVFKL